VEPVKSPVSLSRSIGLFALVVYGVGDMVGAGIYGTIGVAAGYMGNAVWLSFLVSMLAALLTGLTYASLASRYPVAAGAAHIAQRAFGSPLVAFVIGLTVIASGLTSMAAGGRVFAATLGPALPTIPPWMLPVAFLLLLTMINLRGIRECVWVNVLCTAIEVGGLFIVIAVSLPYLGSVNYLETPVDAGGLNLSLVMTGAVLTFFAFVGFEDLLNLSEEVKNPERTMPWGILLAVLCTTILYVLVSVAAVSVVPYTALADASKGAPMAQIVAKAGSWMPPEVFFGITLFAVFNTALMNYIMGSRLIYGMSRQSLLPTWLGRVHPTTQTPYRAILTLACIVMVLIFSGGIADLASATSLLLLLVFAAMNVSLIRLKLRTSERIGQFEIPMLVPIAGAAICLALIAARVSSSTAGWRSTFIAATIIAGIIALYFAGKVSQRLRDARSGAGSS